MLLWNIYENTVESQSHIKCVLMVPGPTKETKCLESIYLESFAYGNLIVSLYFLIFIQKGEPNLFGEHFLTVTTWSKVIKPYFLKA